MSILQQMGVRALQRTARLETHLRCSLSRPASARSSLALWWMSRCVSILWSSERPSTLCTNTSKLMLGLTLQARDTVRCSLPRASMQSSCRTRQAPGVTQRCLSLHLIPHLILFIPGYQFCLKWAGLSLATPPPLIIKTIKSLSESDIANLQCRIKRSSERNK